MTILEILLMLISGLITSNCILGTASGVDLAINGHQSKKFTAIYFVVIVSVTMLSALTSWLLNFVLGSVGLTRFLMFGNLLIVAMYAQIAEFVCSKVAPLFLKNSYGLISTLTFTAYILLTANYFMEYSFVSGVLKLIFELLGVGLVLFIISGIRQSRRYNDLPNQLKGNVLNLIILLVLFVAMYAIV